MFATCFGPSFVGLATCFGASTMMPGSGLAEPVGVCDAAGPHSKTVDKIATAERATKLGDFLMTMSSRGRTFRPDAYTLVESSEHGHLRVKGFLPMTTIDMVVKENADYSPKAVAMSDFGTFET